LEGINYLSTILQILLIMSFAYAITPKDEDSAKQLSSLSLSGKNVFAMKCSLAFLEHVSMIRIAA